MLYVDLETSSGPFSFRYSISTPSSHSAKQIVPEIPCILFLHSGYIAQECFEFQFSDRNLCQFNLIAIDMRGCGETKGIIGSELYTPKESATDVDQIMGKLNLPACHIFGLSNGCIVALELAIGNPSRVSSLTLCSPPPINEPEIVSSGRLEVHHYWVLMNEAKGEDEDQEGLTREQMAAEVMTGTQQLLFNNSREDDVLAIGNFAMVIAKRNWAGSPEKIRQSYKTNVEWFRSRRLIPLEALQMVINVPVDLIHCRDDVAYPLDDCDEWKDLLTRADIKEVSLQEVPGSHYGSVTNPVEVNTILYDTVVSSHPQLARKPYLAGLSKLLTPFTQLLIDAVGYSPYDSDSD